MKRRLSLREILNLPAFRESCEWHDRHLGLQAVCVQAFMRIRASAIVQSVDSMTLVLQTRDRERVYAFASSLTALELIDTFGNLLPRWRAGRGDTYEPDLSAEVARIAGLPEGVAFELVLGVGSATACLGTLLASELVELVDRDLLLEWRDECGNGKTGQA